MAHPAPPAAGPTSSDGCLGGRRLVLCSAASSLSPVSDRLGRAQCPDTHLGHRTAGVAWLRDELGGEDAPDIVFAQELLPGHLTSPPSGYRVIPGLHEPNAAVGCTSALLVRSGLSVDVESPDGRRPFGALGT